MAGISFDAMVAGYVIDPESAITASTQWPRELLGVTPIPIESLIGKGEEAENFAETAIADAANIQVRM